MPNSDLWLSLLLLRQGLTMQLWLARTCYVDQGGLGGACLTHAQLHHASSIRFSSSLQTPPPETTYLASDGLSRGSRSFPLRQCCSTRLHTCKLESSVMDNSVTRVLFEILLFLSMSSTSVLTINVSFFCYKSYLCLSMICKNKIMQSMQHYM